MDEISNTFFIVLSYAPPPPPFVPNPICAKPHLCPPNLCLPHLCPTPYVPNPSCAHPICAHPNYCYNFNICIIIHVGSFPYQLIDSNQQVRIYCIHFSISVRRPRFKIYFYVPIASVEQTQLIHTILSAT